MPSSKRGPTRILLDHTPQDEVGLEIDADALYHPFAYPPEEAADLAPTIRPHYPDPEVERWARRFLHPGGRTETGHLLAARFLMAFGAAKRRYLTVASLRDSGHTARHVLSTGA